MLSGARPAQYKRHTLHRTCKSKFVEYCDLNYIALQIETFVIMDGSGELLIQGPRRYSSSASAGNLKLSARNSARA